MVTLAIFFLDVDPSVNQRFQQPIPTFTRPWDYFMVHDVNNRLSIPRRLFDIVVIGLSRILWKWWGVTRRLMPVFIIQWLFT